VMVAPLLKLVTVTAAWVGEYDKTGKAVAFVQVEGQQSPAAEWLVEAGIYVIGDIYGNAKVYTTVDSALSAINKADERTEIIVKRWPKVEPLSNPVDKLIAAHKTAVAQWQEAGKGEIAIATMITAAQNLGWQNGTAAQIAEYNDLEVRVRAVNMLDAMAQREMGRLAQALLLVNVDAANNYLPVTTA